MNAQLKTNATHLYAADEFSGFLLQLDEYNVDPELDDDEYYLYDQATGELVAFFSEAPTSGPAGGWIRMGIDRYLR